MPRSDLHVAVTGLNATDNPGPGVSVMRALRHEASFRGELVGLAYDTLDPGIYCRELDLLGAFLLPYPSQGTEAILARLRYVHEQARIDVLIPTLDSELPSLIALEDDLARLGIRTFLPTRRQLDLRAKTRLADLGRTAGLDVPEGRIVAVPGELYSLHEHFPWPVVVKGAFYGATVCRTVDEAVAAFHACVATWGHPVLVQQYHPGDEYDVAVLGDGAGGMVGAVPMKKTMLTDKGKGWAGVAVRDPELLAVARRFLAATRWRGPCEVEVLKTAEGRYLLLEVNPRFPAWTYLCAGAGQNLPWATVRLALGEDVGVLPDYRPGTMFVRIALDQIATMDEFREVATHGELRRHGKEAP